MQTALPTDPSGDARHEILFANSVFRNRSVRSCKARPRYNHVGIFVILSFVLPTNPGSGLVVDSLHVACETQLLSSLVVSKAAIQHDTAMLAYTVFFNVCGYILTPGLLLDS